MQNVPFPENYWHDPQWRKQLNREPMPSKNPNPGGWQRKLEERGKAEGKRGGK